MKLKIYILIILFSTIVESVGQGYYSRYSYRTKRHEISFGGGASSCLTDLGGGDDIARGFLWDIDLAKTNFVGNFSYLFNLHSRIVLRTSFSFAKVSGDDALTEEFYRNNRRLNFTSNILETAQIIEWIIIKARTGNRYNLKSPAGRYLGVKKGNNIGLYVFGGIGGFYYDPYGFNRFINENGELMGDGIKYKLRPLKTEGESYQPVAICLPFGIGIKKAFNSQGGIKIEGGFRFTNTDYLDDVSNVYYDWASNGGNSAQITMSGTNTGAKFTHTAMTNEIDANGNFVFPANTTPRPDISPNVYSYDLFHTAPGFQRGNPQNDDSYMFVTLSAYKKFSNRTKSYRTINLHQKRKIKASF